MGSCIELVQRNDLDEEAATACLRTCLTLGAPRDDFDATTRFLPAQQEPARRAVILRARLPAWLKRRRSLMREGLSRCILSALGAVVQLRVLRAERGGGVGRGLTGSSGRSVGSGGGTGLGDRSAARRDRASSREEREGQWRGCFVARRKRAAGRGGAWRAQEGAGWTAKGRARRRKAKLDMRGLHMGGLQ